MVVLVAVLAVRWCAGGSSGLGDGGAGGSSRWKDGDAGGSSGR